MMQDRTGEKAQKSANYDENMAAIPARMDRPIVLIGMMGSGKTQLGRKLAAVTGLVFADSDIEFEAASGCSIADYFAKYGEDAFRDGEYKIMQRLLDGTPRIVSAGGGAVVRAETRALIRDKSCAVWLKADPSVLAQRCAAGNKRPLLQNGDPETVLRDLLEKRSACYEEAAAFTIDTGKGCGDEALRNILEGLKNWADRQ